ncbi:hypothetical protein CP8484711_0040, partial [Chlamydia psittaci 84-8471/1]
ATS